MIISSRYKCTTSPNYEAEAFLWNKELWLHVSPKMFWNGYSKSNTTAFALRILNQCSKWWQPSSLAGIMTGIRAGRLENRGSILDETVGIIIFASISKLWIWANPFFTLWVSSEHVPRGRSKGGGVVGTQLIHLNTQLTVKKNWSYTSIERPRHRAGCTVSYLPFVPTGMKRELSLPYLQNKYEKCTPVLSTDRFQTACVFSFLILHCKLEVSDVKSRGTVWMAGDWFPAGASAIFSNPPSLLFDVERRFLHYRESDWTVNQRARLNFIPRYITTHLNNTWGQG